MIKEKIPYLKGSLAILDKSRKERKKYSVRILGKRFIVHPDVFSPKYFSDPEFFAEKIPVKKGDDFLEIGSGTGVITVFAVLKGAKSAVATDISLKAVENTKENIKLHKMGAKVDVLRGNLYEPIREKRTFDIIFWNVPFGYVKKEIKDPLTRTIFDTKYENIKRYILDSRKYLKPEGRVIIGFSRTIGNFKELKRLIKMGGFSYSIIAQKHSMAAGGLPVTFEIIECK